ncbi:MAG: hypothetical protein HY751_05010 [Nitrospinae bacterium]|nr:hypothetical protein [Nitrospinota bacterium]
MPSSGFLNQSTRKRLPASIRALPELDQVVFIFLRMRRDEFQIARQLKLGRKEALEAIARVRDALIKNGSLDMVEDPVFYPLDIPATDNEKEYPPINLKTGGMDMTDSLEITRFHEILRQSISMMPREGRRLLSLWFTREMKAADILKFYRNLGVNLISGKPIENTGVGDVFYAIEKNSLNLLKIVRSNMKQGEFDITPAVLKAALDEVGVSED